LDTETQIADKIVSTAIVSLTLAVSRKPRGVTPEVGYVVTSDPDRSKETYGSQPGYTVTASSETVLQLVLAKLNKHTINEGTGLFIRTRALERPWFDISIDELPHELVLKIAKVYPLRA
jgi:hypothetical protein